MGDTGGIKQRMSARSESLAAFVDTVDDEQPARDAIGSQWKKSGLSAPEVQRLTRASKSSEPEVKSLAAAGNGGKAPKNLSKDIGRIKSKTSSQPQVYQQRISCWDHDRSKQMQLSTIFLMPYEQLNNLIDAGTAMDTTRAPNVKLVERLDKLKATLDVPSGEPAADIGI